ncbi:preprotein translocase subunit SecE [Fibrella sp. HMF5335]|uniref:Protein translocase subunit SecE n=1 Tax=Fibrella rubiginis TaxID=2817060 RepID=A0A939GK95_9BACT|nr:preprotein translocase subunit SecE [Fibrella rubiginis]MBO0939388.1 preprotein translocase subunit SecE [Fibrella rubiginis]
MEKVTTFLKHSWEEVQHNVTWPKFSDLQASSSLVLIASLIFALLVGMIDYVFENALNFFYRSF